MRGSRRALPRRAGLLREAVLLFLAAELLLGWVPAFSQAAVASIAISNVDTRQFPLVSLQVVALDPGGRPVEFLPAASLNVLEDGVQASVQSVESADVGMRVLFAVDPGDGVFHTGVGLGTTYTSSLGHLQTYLVGRPWMLPEVDRVSVLVQEGGISNLLVPWSTDPNAILQTLQAYVAPSDAGFSRAPRYGDYSRAALNRALDEIEFATTDQDKLPAIVLFTPGFRADLTDVAERALAIGVPIHIVFVQTREAPYWSDAPEALALATGGRFLPLFPTANMEGFFRDLTVLRRQQVVTYRSVSASTSPRQVILNLVAGDQTLSAESAYTVDLQDPQVAITTPTQGTILTRQGEEGADPAEALPSFVDVAAQINWPDGLPRRIRAAELLVDNAITGQVHLTEDQVVVTWDIRAYQSRGQVPVVLQVVVEDELGLQGASAPVTVGLQYEGPGGMGLPDEIMVYVSLGVAVLALAFALILFFNRKKLGPAFQQASEGIVDFVERVTGRRSALVARAYLVPLEGFDEPPSKAYEIYGTTAIGRSRRHADLLFHINEEDSPISRLHCTILDEDDHFEIRDEDSSNGTYVNGEKLTPLTSIMLHDGDTIDVAPLERGGLRLLFQLAATDGSQRGAEDEFRRTQPRQPIDRGRAEG